MDQGQYLIDELCRLSGFSRRTVRYYVQEGLVDPPAARGRGGFYSDVQLGQLARIKELQERGYRLDAIRGQLMRPKPSSPVVAGLGGPKASHAAWTRIAVGTGVELHVSAEAERRLGPAIPAALEALRTIIQQKGGSK
jgi:DNA-binding transcriptional MerR regulator